MGSVFLSNLFRLEYAWVKAHPCTYILSCCLPEQKWIYVAFEIINLALSESKSNFLPIKKLEVIRKCSLTNLLGAIQCITKDAMQTKKCKSSKHLLSP